MACGLCVDYVKDVGLTAHISARNSCVKATVLLPARSALCSTQRQNRRAVKGSALQAAVTRACDNSTSLYRMQRLRTGSLAAAAVLKWAAAILLQASGTVTTTRTSDFYR